MLWTLSHAIVHMVAFWCNDPVVPLDILKLDVEVSLAAHGHVVTTTQRALSDRMLGVVVTETHLGHQERLIRGVSTAVEGAQILAILFTADLKVKPALATIQKSLQNASGGERVPVTLLDLQHLFYHQRAIRAQLAIICRKENSGSKSGVPVKILR